MPFFLKIWLWSLPVIGVFATFDAIILVFWTDRLNVARKMNTIHAIGHAETVELILSCTKRSIQPGKIRVFDMYDEIFDCDAFPAALTAPAFGETISFFYELLPVQRGNWKSGMRFILKGVFTLILNCLPHRVVLMR